MRSLSPAFRLFMVALLLLSFSGPLLAAPTVSLTASPSAGVGSADVTLTWSSTGAASCVASGAWSGVKALTGTQVVTGVTATSTFTLTCTEGSASAVLTWTPPTTNTDGSALTNLASYKIYHAGTSAGVAGATPITVAAPATTYTVTGLSAGARHFGIKAVNAAGIESDMSNLASKTIVLASAATNATVTISTKPNAPALLTVDQVARLWLNDKPSLVAGKIALGVECGEVKQGQWAKVDRDDVRLNFWGKLVRGTVVAKCAVA